MVNRSCQKLEIGYNYTERESEKKGKSKSDQVRVFISLIHSVDYPGVLCLAIDILAGFSHRHDTYFSQKSLHNLFLT